jgi:hypothetical protein
MRPTLALELIFEEVPLSVPVPGLSFFAFFLLFRGLGWILLGLELREGLMGGLVLVPYSILCVNSKDIRRNKLEVYLIRDDPLFPLQPLQFIFNLVFV